MKSDIRVTPQDSASTSNSLPHTSHAGKCGMTGHFITLPSSYLLDSTEDLTGKDRNTWLKSIQFKSADRIKQSKRKLWSSNGLSSGTEFLKNMDIQVTIYYPIFIDILTTMMPSLQATTLLLTEI